MSAPQDEALVRHYFAEVDPLDFGLFDELLAPALPEPGTTATTGGALPGDAVDQPTAGDTVAN